MRSSELVSSSAKRPSAPGASNRTRKSSRLPPRSRHERRGASRSPRRVQIVPSQAERSARTVRSVASRTHGSFGSFESSFEPQADASKLSALDLRSLLMSPLRGLTGRQEDRKTGSFHGGLRASPRGSGIEPRARRATRSSETRSVWSHRLSTLDSRPVDPIHLRSCVRCAADGKIGRLEDWKTRSLWGCPNAVARIASIQPLRGFARSPPSNLPSSHLLVFPSARAAGLTKMCRIYSSRLEQSED
jgi:hypothetical protein